MDVPTLHVRRYTYPGTKYIYYKRYKCVHIMCVGVGYRFQDIGYASDYNSSSVLQKSRNLSNVMRPLSSLNIFVTFGNSSDSIGSFKALQRSPKSLLFRCFLSPLAAAIAWKMFRMHSICAGVGANCEDGIC